MTVPFAQDVTLKRYTAGVHVAGTWVDGTPSTSTIQASIQPAKESEYLRLPEGARTRGAVSVFSEDEVVAGNESTGIVPDEVTYQSEQWEISMVEPWIVNHHTPELLHYKALALRVSR